MANEFPESFKLPTRAAKVVTFAVSIPEYFFGHRVTIQARKINPPKNAFDVCDGEKCYQTDATAHVKFFGTNVNWDAIDKN